LNLFHTQWRPDAERPIGNVGKPIKVTATAPLETWKDPFRWRSGSAVAGFNGWLSNRFASLSHGPLVIAEYPLKPVEPQAGSLAMGRGDAGRSPLVIAAGPKVIGLW